jgi:hypothetical protein
LTFLRVGGKGGTEDADVWANDTVIPNFDLTNIVDRAVASNDNVIADGNVVPIVTDKGRFYNTMAADPSNVCNRRRNGGRHTHGIARLQDFQEQARSLFRRNAIRRRRREIVEPPTGGSTSLSFETELLIEWIIGSSGKHLLLLGSSRREL